MSTVLAFGLSNNNNTNNHGSGDEDGSSLPVDSQTGLVAR